jgi:hypothetical protein
MTNPYNEYNEPQWEQWMEDEQIEAVEHKMQLEKEAAGRREQYFQQMHIDNKIEENNLAAPDQTAVEKQAEMTSYWQEMLQKMGLGNKKAPQSEAEKLINRSLWQKL